MESNQNVDVASRKMVYGTSFSVLLALSLSHLSNDALQSLVPAIYPLVKESLSLNFSQIGIIVLVFQLFSSLLQPFVGWITDKKPQPYALPVGMFFTMIGILSLSVAHSFWMVLVSVAFIGIGSSIFHPEASRLAHMASGGKLGMAQSFFQVGGNFGSSMGPLLAALVIAPYGQRYVAWFGILAFLTILLMLKISRWYKNNLHRIKPKPEKHMDSKTELGLSKKKIGFSLVILMLLIFSKYAYMASLTNYYTFYLMHKFGVSVQGSQFYLFIFLFAVAAGTFAGGPLGDRIGRKYVIWISILGVAPFALLMPHANLLWTCILSVFIGLILSSAFSAILVYAQELLPGRVGMIAGLFFGFAFGVAGVCSAVLGKIADNTSIEQVYTICSYLPLIGLITWFLPDIKKKKEV